MNKLKTLVASTLLGLLPVAGVQAAEYNLRFAHFWPTSSEIPKNFEAWGRSVEAASDGRIEVEFYPAQTLAKAPQSYDAVKNHIADITATIQGYSANRFPLTQITELPGLGNNAAQGSCVAQSLYDEGLISGEYDDTHVLFLFTHGPGDIHSKQAINKPEDLVGLKIRRPTTVIAELLELAGAKPVAMPAPEIFPALQRGVTDGVTLPWEGIKSFRLNSEVDHHTEIGLYRLAFVVTMNKSVYEGMPDDLKQVIDEHSGKVWSQRLAEAFDKGDIAGRNEAVSAGHEIIKIEGGVNHPDWKPILDATTEHYLSGLEDQGLPARDVYARALELSENCNG